MINEKLYRAVESGPVNEVEKALTEEKLSTMTYFGAKSIILSVKNGQIEILRMLLESSVSIPRASFWSNKNNIAISTLTRAVKSDHMDILKLLLEYGANEVKKRYYSAIYRSIGARECGNVKSFA